MKNIFFCVISSVVLSTATNNFHLLSYRCIIPHKNIQMSFILSLELVLHTVMEWSYSSHQASFTSNANKKAKFESSHSKRKNICFSNSPVNLKMRQDHSNQHECEKSDGGHRHAGLCTSWTSEIKCLMRMLCLSYSPMTSPTCCIKMKRTNCVNMEIKAVR